MKLDLIFTVLAGLLVVSGCNSKPPSEGVKLPTNERGMTAGGAQDPNQAGKPVEAGSGATIGDQAGDKGTEGKTFVPGKDTTKGKPLGNPGDQPRPGDGPSQK